MRSILKHRRKMNKKGIFFTILAIAMLSLFLVSYGIYSFVQNREGINKRIKTMNSYVSSLDTDIPRKLYISGYRVIFLLEEEIIKSGDYIINVNSSFAEAFFNGTINSIDYRFDDLGNPGLLYDSTFQDIENNINTRAEGLNLDVTFRNPKIIITQDDPWHVKVILESNLLIEDKGGLASWNRTKDFHTYIPITNFEDPLYVINTNAKVVNKFVRTNYTAPISPTEIMTHAENSYYINHTDAPSFLKRLEGDLSADENGIESLVNTHRLSSQGISVIDKCVIDYIYFNPSDAPSYHLPAGAESWVKIADDHTEVYG